MSACLKLLFVCEVGFKTGCRLVFKCQWKGCTTNGKSQTVDVKYNCFTNKNKYCTSEFLKSTMTYKGPCLFFVRCTSLNECWHWTCSLVLAFENEFRPPLVVYIITLIFPFKVSSSASDCHHVRYSDLSNAIHVICSTLSLTVIGKGYDILSLTFYSLTA